MFLDYILECIDLIEDYSEGVTESEFMEPLSQLKPRILSIRDELRNL